MSNSSKKSKAEILKIRKRRKRILGSVIFVFSAAIILSVLAFVFCRVETVTVKGDSPYSHDEIRNTLSQSLGRSMFTVDTDSLEDYIETILPYTDNVRISKKFPKTLTVKSETAKKVFAVELSERMFAVTDKKLKLLEAGTAVPPGAIPVECNGITTYEIGKPLDFSSKAGEDPSKSILTEIKEAADNEELKDISLINISDLDAVYFIYDGRILVRLGSGSNIADKISLAKKTLDEENKLSPAQYGSLDLSINKKAVFSPDDAEDIPEITAYLEKKEEITSLPEEAPAQSTVTDGELPTATATDTAAYTQANATETNPA